MESFLRTKKIFFGPKKFGGQNLWSKIVLVKNSFGQKSFGDKQICNTLVGPFLFWKACDFYFLLFYFLIVAKIK